MMNGINPGFRMLIILLGTPLIILAVHAALARGFRNLSPQAVAVYSALSGYLPTAFLLWHFVFRTFSVYGMAMAGIYCFLVYTGFAYTYFHFFNMSETARRIRLLYEIYRAGSLGSGDIVRLYRTSDIINLRLERLVSTSQLKLEDGYYSLDRKLLYFAAVLVSFWRKILGFKENSG